MSFFLCTAESVSRNFSKLLKGKHKNKTDEYLKKVNMKVLLYYE